MDMLVVSINMTPWCMGAYLLNVLVSVQLFVNVAYNRLKD